MRATNENRSGCQHYGYGNNMYHSYLRTASGAVGASLLHKFSSNRFLRLDRGYYNTPHSNYRTPDYFSTASGGTGTHNNIIARSFHGNIQYNHSASRQTTVIRNFADRLARLKRQRIKRRSRRRDGIGSDTVRPEGFRR